MTKEQILSMALRNKEKAFRTFMNCSQKNGIKDDERDNLWHNVEYANLVYDLVCKEVGTNENH